jgi:hypothetical protein
MLKKLESQILFGWQTEGNSQDPYEYVLEVLGNMTLDYPTCKLYMKALVENGFIPDFTEAIENGFDDYLGFVFFYVLKYLIKDSDILSKMRRAC